LLEIKRFFFLCFLFSKYKSAARLDASNRKSKSAARLDACNRKCKSAAQLYTSNRKCKSAAWLDTSVRKCKPAYSLYALEAVSLINLVAAEEVAMTLESFIPEVAVMGWKAASASVADSSLGLNSSTSHW
jgi:hypothetical protein